MDCFDTRQLFAFAQGELGAEAAVPVEKHLDSCAVCRALLAEAARASGGPESQPSEPGPPAGGPVHPWLSRGSLLGRYVVLELGRAEEALRTFEHAARIREKHLGPADPKFASSLSGMGRALAKQGRYREAAEHHQRAVAIREKALGAESPQVAIDLLGLGGDFLGMNVPLKARVPLERAAAIFEREPAGTADGNLAEVRFALARALASEPRDLEKARQFAGAALEHYRRFPRTRAPDLEQVERWLAEHGGSPRPIAPQR